MRTWILIEKHETKKQKRNENEVQKKTKGYAKYE